MAESGFRIKTCVLGMVSTNCYLVYHETTKKGVIIDPADNGEYLVRKLKELGVTPEAVLLTHGHFDHIMAADALRREFSAKVYCSESEAELVSDPVMNVGRMFGMECTVAADKTFRLMESSSPYQYITPRSDSSGILFLTSAARI